MKLEYSPQLLLSLCGFAVGASIACAQPTIYEPWDYSNLSLAQGADIIGQTGTGSVGFDAGAPAWGFVQGSGSATYDAAGLSYLDDSFNSLNNSGGAATITPAEGDTKFDRVIASFIDRPAEGSGEPPTNFWISYLLRLDATDTGTPGDAFWTTDGAWDKGAVGFQANPEIRFVNGETSGVTSNVGETYLVVANLSMAELELGLMDTASLYVNPQLTGTAPASPDATFMAGATTEDNDRIRIFDSVMFKFNATNNGTYTIDEFRVGDTFASVTPFDSSGLTALAQYNLASTGDGATDRNSSDTEPLTAAGSLVGGIDPAGTGGGISIPGDDFNEANTDDAFAAGDFIEFTVALDQATSMSLSALNFSIDLESTESVFDYALRSSIDGFAADILPQEDDFDGVSPGTALISENLSGLAEFQGLTSDVTFRLAFAEGLADVGSGNGALLTNLEVIGSVVGGDDGLDGDFNDDGVVDAADYVLWRNNLGASDESAINDNGDGGGVTQDDYDLWVANFGNTSGSASLEISAAVPEATTLFGIVFGMGLLLMGRTGLRKAIDM